MNKPRFKYYWFDQPFYSMPVKDGLSDVSGQTLLDNGFPIPITPTLATWHMMIEHKQRCPKCYMVVRGPADVARHIELNHKEA